MEIKTYKVLETLPVVREGKPCRFIRERSLFINEISVELISHQKH